MPLTLITPPATEPVTLAQAKAHCRIDGTADDALVGALIAAAREACEHKLGRPLITQTWERALEYFAGGAILLGKFKPLSIVSVNYLDDAGADTLLDPSAYTLDDATEPGYLLPAYGTSWPSARPTANSVRVRFTAGYGPAASDVPIAIQQWILIAVGSMYEQRTGLADKALGSVPFIDALLDAERIYQ
ncbi:MAG: head-tail connector protein [Candidatus Accumulibacter phosphatis]